MASPPSNDGALPRTYHRPRKTRKPAAALFVVVAGLAMWLRWRPYRIEVEGESMVPTLRAGDWALAITARGVRRGDVVVLEHRGRPGFELVKRVVDPPVARSLREGELWVQGDAPMASTDSRVFGPVGPEAIRGRVVLVWWPPARWGWISRS